MNAPHKSETPGGAGASEGTGKKTSGSDFTHTPTTAQGWRDHKVMTFKGLNDTRTGTDECYRLVTLAQVFDKKPNSLPKGEAWAILPSSFNGPEGRSAIPQKEHGSFVCLTLDLDGGNLPMSSVESAIEDFAGESVAHLIYSSASATPEEQKWRGIIPLAEPVGYESWLELQMAFHAHFLSYTLVGPDAVFLNPQQPIFLQNVPPERRGEDGEPLFCQTTQREGTGLTLDDGFVAHELEKVRVLRAREDAEHARMKQESAARVQARLANAGGLQSPIDAFNAMHTVEDMLLASGYTRRGHTSSWKSPNQRGKSFATKDWGDYWTSMSGSDTDAGVGKKSNSSGCHGDAFDLFCFYQHSGDQKAATKAAAGICGIQKKPPVQAPVVAARPAVVESAQINSKHALVSVEPSASPVTNTKQSSDVTALHQFAMQVGTEDSVALVFSSVMNGKVCFVHERGQWMEWNGKQWLVDATGKAFDKLRKLTRDYNVGNSKSMGKASFVKGVETLCKHDRNFARSIVQFDCDNYMLNTGAGVVDLRTGQLQPHNPELMLSKFTPVCPAPTGGKNFLKAIDEICNHDQELVRFHQVSIGAMLSGAVEEHWFLFWFGQGRNGKNVLADVFFKAMGSYAHKMPSEALMSTKNERHPTDLAALAGQRMVLSSEVADGAYWNESRIKELTGDATLTARFMRQDGFIFNRTHKHLALGNYRPHLQSGGSGMVSRMKLVPFNVSFVGREDPDLPAKLEAELPFILNWLIEGHMMWLANGKRLPKCQAVEDASKDYVSSQATIQMWLTERCTLDDGCDSAYKYGTPNDLYSNYKEWKLMRGENPTSMQRWSENMANAGFEKSKSNGARYKGVKLKPAEFY